MKTPSFRLDGRVALVTGAGPGIGGALAFALAEAGAGLVLNGRRREALEALAEEIAAAGHAAPRLMPCDVSDKAAMADAIGRLPRLDVLVNNAGVNIPEPLAEISEAHFDHIMGLNVRALFFTSQAGVAKMLEHPDRPALGGSIINLSSQMGHVGSPNRIVYCASKHAVEGLTKAMAVELAPVRIRVNAIAPTFVDTPLIRRIMDTPEKREPLVSKIPLGGMASVEDLMGAAIYLASPASAMVTGASLLVDGGWTAQ